MQSLIPGDLPAFLTQTSTAQRNVFTNFVSETTSPSALSGIDTPIVIGTSNGLAASVTSLTMMATQASPVGNTIIVFADTHSSGTVTCVDSVGNTYVGLTPQNLGGVKQIFYCPNALSLPAGATITVANSGSASRFSVIALTVSGLSLTAPLDFQATGITGTSGAGVAPQPSITSSTLAEANELLIGWTEVTSGFADAYTESDGFTQLGFTTSVHYTLRLSYRIVNATTPVTYAPNLGAAKTYVSQLVSFKIPETVAPPVAVRRPSSMSLLGAG